KGIVSQQAKTIRLITGMYTAAARATVERLLYSTNSRLSGCKHIPVDMAEQEGLEPPTPLRAAAFKAGSSSSHVCSTATHLILPGEPGSATSRGELIPVSILRPTVRLPLGFVAPTYMLTISQP